MPLPKISDARALSDEELAQEIVNAKRELFNLRFKQGTRQEGEAKPHEFKHLKHRISQLLTVERERELAQAKAVTTEEETNNDN